MSVMTTVFDVLAADTSLKTLLGSHALAPDYPAIYETWAIEDIPMPYMVISWGFDSGEVSTKFDSSIIMDIFTAGTSTLMAETIRNRLIELLERNTFFSEGEGTIRTHYVRDGNVPEPEEEVTHWMIEFRVIYWDASIINAITKRS